VYGFKELLKIKLKLTGKEGYRTKFQTFKVPQLVVEMKNEIQKKDEEESSQAFSLR